MKEHVGGKAAGTTRSGGHASHTGQMFFSDAIADTGAKRAPHNARTVARARNAADRPYARRLTRSGILLV